MSAARHSASWRRSRPVWSAGALIVLVLTAGCGSDPIHKDDTFMDAQTTGVLHIEGGECFTDPTYEAAAAEDVVTYKPCEEGADNQSYKFVHAPE